MPTAETKDKTTTDTLHTLQDAAKHLLFMSESDRPLKAFVWDDEKIKGTDNPLNALVTEKAVDKTNIKTLSVAEFFEPMTDVQDWMGDLERPTAAQFAALVDTIGKTLTGAQALRVEGSEADKSLIDVYVVGKDAAGKWAGVFTQIVET